MAAGGLRRAVAEVRVVAGGAVAPLVVAGRGAGEGLEGPERRVVVLGELLSGARLVDVAQVEEAVEGPGPLDPVPELVVVDLGRGAVADRPDGRRLRMRRSGDGDARGDGYEKAQEQ